MGIVAYFGAFAGCVVQSKPSAKIQPLMQGHWHRLNLRASSKCWCNHHGAVTLLGCRTVPTRLRTRPCTNSIFQDRHPLNKNPQRSTHMTCSSWWLGFGSSIGIHLYDFISFSILPILKCNFLPVTFFPIPCNKNAASRAFKDEFLTQYINSSCQENQLSCFFDFGRLKRELSICMENA